MGKYRKLVDASNMSSIFQDQGVEPLPRYSIVQYRLVVYELGDCQHTSLQDVDSACVINTSRILMDTSAEGCLDRSTPSRSEGCDAEQDV